MEDPTHVSESDVRMRGGCGSAAETEAAAAGCGRGGGGRAPVELTAHMFPETDAPALHIRVAVPSDAARTDVCCLLLVDTSGSMSTPCTLKDSSSTEGASFCSLDLVMHAARTLGRSLTIQDMLGVIAFSDAASVVMPPRRMGTDEAVDILDASLAALRPSGMTNVWDAMRTAAQVAERMATDHHDVHVLLLTDGAANINPSVGLVRAVHDLGATMARPWTLHCFGFGSMADTATLQALAGDAGIVGFIPDASMVGTTFINFAAMLLTLVESRVRVQLERDGTEPVIIDMGSLCAGQPRDAVVRLLPGTKHASVHVRLQPSHSTSASPHAVPVILADAGTPLPADPFLRLRLLEVVEASIAQLERGPEHVDTVCSHLHTVHAVAATWPAGDGAPFVDGVCRDIVAREKDEGQLCLAPQYVHAGTRWGVHYLRSYASALRHQFRANFKDCALQCFGGAPFDAVQRVAAAIFDNMPAARPLTLAASVAYVPPASMAAYNNAAGGCFNPYTQVRMADGGLQHVCDLKRGDAVMTYGGRTARVDFVVEYNSRRAFPLYTVRHSLYISPWHPVRDGDDGEWTFPAERPDSINYDEGWHTVFNLVLSCDHVITLENGLQAVTLGHGLRGPVVSHPYFGSMEAIMADLMPLRGFEHGRPRFRTLREQRCAHSGIVCGMIDEDAMY